MGTELHFKTRDQLDWDDVISGNYFLYYTMFGQHNSLKRMEEVRRNRQWMPFPCDCPKVVTKTGERQPRKHGKSCIYGAWKECHNWYHGKQQVLSGQNAKGEKSITAFLKEDSVWQIILSQARFGIGDAANL